MPRTGSIILLDVESTLWTAVHDKTFQRCQPQTIVRAFTRCVEGLALSIQRPPCRRIGAVSPLPRRYNVRSPQSSGHKLHSIITALVSQHYVIKIVPRGPNSVDDELCQFDGQWAVHSPDIKTLILVTEDGREPFPALIQDFVDAGKEVYVVGYRRVPAGLRFQFQTLRYTTIAAQVNSLLAGNGSDVGELTLSSPSPFTKSILACIRNLSEDHHTRTVNMIHLEWVKRAIRIWAEKINKKTDGPYAACEFSTLVDLLEEGLDSWPSPRPTESELKELVLTLSQSFLFRKLNSYALSHESDLLRTVVRPHEAPSKASTKMP